MAKLHFRYGAMGSGKSAHLINVAYNYLEKHQNIAILHPDTDKRSYNKIKSRNGTEIPANTLKRNDDVFKAIGDSCPYAVKCVFVDEAQFLTKKQVDDLHILTKKYNTTVICYGLRCDRFQKSWEGSKRLLEIADSLEELETMCSCGKKATFNCMFNKDKEIVTKGPQTLIDKNLDGIFYESLCPKCYYAKIGKI